VRRGRGRGQDKARRRKIWLPKAAALITILFGSTRPAIRSGVTERGDCVALLRGCAFDGLGGDDNALGRLDFSLIRGEGVPRAALMTSMRLVFVLGFPNATEAVGGRLITNLFFVAKKLYVTAATIIIKNRKTPFVVAITAAHFTNRRSVPGLLLELKRGRRVDAARRDRRRGAHDERNEGRAQNRLTGAAASLRRDERPLPACFFL
jgi:hypothetical protein